MTSSSSSSRRGGGGKLRPWLLEQLESGKFAGLVWDDPERSALRIPWQHGGKGGVKGGAGSALCRAWAEFKGRAPIGCHPDPAGWKTRLRCALHKSPELQELPHRACPTGPNPYKVYRLLPHSQAAQPPPKCGSLPPKSGSRKEPGGSPGEGAGESSELLPHSATPPEPDEATPTEPPIANVTPTLTLLVDSPEPLPPATGDCSLGLWAWLGDSLAYHHWFPAGEYLIGPALDHVTSGPPPALPRLLLHLTPPLRSAPPPALANGLLVSSGPRGLFLRLRGRGLASQSSAQGGVVLRGGSHASQDSAPLRVGDLVQAFDAQRYREAVAQYQAGLCPRPQPRVTLSVELEPHKCTLLLQLEQAFAQQLLDGSEGTTGATAEPVPHTNPTATPK